MLECGRHPQKGAAQNLKGWYKALEDLVWLTQLGLNMLLPLVLCLAGCWWAVAVSYTHLTLPTIA